MKAPSARVLPKPSRSVNQTLESAAAKKPTKLLMKINDTMLYETEYSSCMRSSRGPMLASLQPISREISG